MITHKIRTVIACLLVTIVIITTPLSTMAEEVEIKDVLDLEKWTGDLDGMVERKRIRALVSYSKTFYFFDGAEQRGITFEALRKFEQYINKMYKTGTLKVHVIIIPTPRDKLLPWLVEGRGDIVAANLTITPRREKVVDFSTPGLTGVEEILVTGPKAPAIKTIDDLAGREVHVRKSSSYYQSLVLLNEQFKKERKKKIEIVLADELLEDEDLLEMMNAGLIPMTVIDSHKGGFWSQIFTELVFHEDITVRTGAKIGWALRRNSPELKAALDGFANKVKKGTLTGNILFKRYLQDTRWVENSTNKESFKRFQKASRYFQKYADTYDFDWLMIAALAYQESRIDQGMRSPAGAVGVMQMLPSTAADPNVGMSDIHKMENNIHAGVKYLRFIRDRYFEDEPMDELNKVLFTFAGYNAGPARVAKLRREAKAAGYDPNVWFYNVEVIAAKRIGRETVQYVSNIYKYYLAYAFAMKKLDKKEIVKEKQGL